MNSSYYEQIYIMVKNKKDYIYFIPRYNEFKDADDVVLKTIYKDYGLFSKQWLGSSKTSFSKLYTTTQIFEYNLAMMTIEELKIIVAEITDINVFDLYLYGKRDYLEVKEQFELTNRNKMFNEPVYDDIILGFQYKSEYGVRSIPGNYVEASESDLRINTLDVMEDTSQYIVSHFNLKNNVIFMSSRDDVYALQSNGSIEAQYMDNILSTYFPFKNPYKSVDSNADGVNAVDDGEYALYFDEKLAIIKEKNKQLNAFLKTNVSQSLTRTDLKFNNLVFHLDPQRRMEVNLERIFKNFEFDNTICFINYFDMLKNNFYRINQVLLFPNMTKIQPHSLADIKSTIKILSDESSAIDRKITAIKRNYSKDMPIESDYLSEIMQLEENKLHITTEIQTLQQQKSKLETSSEFDFSDISKYIVDYIEGKYNPIIDKKTLLNWKRNIYLNNCLEEEGKLRMK